MHIPAIHADQHTEPVLTGWLAHLVLDIGTGPDGGGITFGSLADGIVVAQRRPGVWSVSFRPIASNGSRRRYYTSPHVVSGVIITREHDAAAAVPRPDQAAAEGGLRARLGRAGRDLPRRRPGPHRPRTRAGDRLMPTFGGKLRAGDVLELRPLKVAGRCPNPVRLGARRGAVRGGRAHRQRRQLRGLGSPPALAGVRGTGCLDPGGPGPDWRTP